MGWTCGWALGMKWWQWSLLRALFALIPEGRQGRATLDRARLSARSRKLA